MVLVKCLRFCQLFVLWKIQREKVFGDVLLRKQGFLDNRNMDLRKPENWNFSKGVSPWFWSKSWSFFIFCVYQTQIKKKCLLMLWIEKKRFKTLRTSVYEERKICFIWREKVNRFCQNFEIYSTLNVMQNRPKESLWERSTEKKVYL